MTNTLPIPRNLLLILAALLFLSTSAPAQSTAPTSEPSLTRPDPQIKRVMIISIDGLRPDLALRANTPVLHHLLDTGSFTFWARTTAFAITLPSHASMLTGVIPTKHGIEWNSDLPLIHPVYPAWPTLFQLAKRAGYTTAMVAGKSKFINLAVPGSLDWVFIPAQSKIEDNQVTAIAVDMINQHQPQVMFVHLPSVDNVGHAAGWATPQQLAAIANADACVGRILAALQSQNVLATTLLILSADHGGTGKSHGPDDPRSRHIPWIAVGPGIKQNFDLTTLAELDVNTEDTFATACNLLAIPIPKPIDGKPILQILQSRELMKSP